MYCCSGCLDFIILFRIFKNAVSKSAAAGAAVTTAIKIILAKIATFFCRSMKLVFSEQFIWQSRKWKKFYKKSKYLIANAFLHIFLRVILCKEWKNVNTQIQSECKWIQVISLWLDKKKCVHLHISQIVRTYRHNKMMKLKLFPVMPA